MMISVPRSEEHTSELQSLRHLVCRLLLEKKNIQFTSCLDSEAGVHHPTQLNPGMPTSDHEYSPQQLPSAEHGHSAYVHFFFKDTAPPEIYSLSLHDPLPI